MPSTPTVSRWPQNISDGPGARPSSTPMTFGRPGAASCSTTSSPAAAMAAARDLRRLGFAWRAGHERRVDGIRGDEVAEGNGSMRKIR